MAIPNRLRRHHPMSAWLVIDDQRLVSRDPRRERFEMIASDRNRGRGLRQRLHVQDFNLCANAGIWLIRFALEKVRQLGQCGKAIALPRDAVASNREDDAPALRWHG